VLSFDGIEEVYTYIRNSSWETFVENLNIFKKHISNKIVLHTTLQNYNIHQYYKLTEFANEHNCTWSTNLVVRPSFLAINILSESAKDYVLEIMKNSRLSKIIQTKFDPLLLDKFYKYTYELDNMRNQQLKELIPHLQEIK